MKENKISFWKKIKTSIFDFDGYQDLAIEKVSRTIVYIVFLMLIFGIIVSFAYTFKFSQIINEAKDYINNEIAEINYENYELNVKLNSGESTEIDSNNMLVDKVIINTNIDNQEEINKNIDKISSQTNGILILKDKVIFKTSLNTNTIEYSYKDISETYNINNISKEEIIKILSGNEFYVFMTSFFMAMFVYMFIVYLSSILVDILLIAIIAYIVARIMGLKLKYSIIYNMATYSLTLPIILNIIYIVVNMFTGFTIEYFRIMYTAIASIYIITAILIIKSDVIKKQLELNKIIEEQEKVKQELRQKEEEKEQQEELERRENEKRKEKDREKEENDNSEKEPEGNNA